MAYTEPNALRHEAVYTHNVVGTMLDHLFYVVPNQTKHDVRVDDVSRLVITSIRPLLYIRALALARRNDGAHLPLPHETWGHHYNSRNISLIAIRIQFDSLKLSNLLFSRVPTRVDP